LTNELLLKLYAIFFEFFLFPSFGKFAFFLLERPFKVRPSHRMERRGAQSCTSICQYYWYRCNQNSSSFWRSLQRCQSNI